MRGAKRPETQRPSCSPAHETNGSTIHNGFRGVQECVDAAVGGSDVPGSDPAIEAFWLAACRRPQLRLTYPTVAADSIIPHLSYGQATLFFSSGLCAVLRSASALQLSCMFYAIPDYDRPCSFAGQPLQVLRCLPAPRCANRYCSRVLCPHLLRFPNST
jgi:hypothetical protein